MRPISLKYKVAISLAILLMVAMSLFVLFVARQHREELLQGAVGHVNQLSEVIIRSTRFAMLQNEPSWVFSIIKDVGNDEHIDRVRIISKDGTITHSTFRPEIGVTVDRNAEACFHCHQGAQPLSQIPTGKRARFFSNGDGGRLLGSMAVIRNEPSCYTASCHAHSADQSVLGVLDIVYSLEEIDRLIQTHSARVVGVSLAFIAFVSLGISFFVHRMVYVPLRDLEAGARRLASGDLEQPIPVRSGDEFGRLAGSFNDMTKALEDSQRELKEWAHTLEEKVAAKTRELHAAQAESAQREKLASVGLLAAGIAHELNNPLTGILTFSHLTRGKMAEGSPEAEDLDLVIQETKRCSTIIKRLLDFAREKTPEKRYADLNRIIEDTVQLVDRSAYVHDIEIATELDPDLPQIWVDEDQIKQVIMNMLVNAQHAIEDEGRITIRSRRAPEPKSPEPGAPPVPMVELSISDSGSGIAEKDLRRIFDPFFTTKGVGRGTGLGLSVSHGIVKAHNGAIEVQSAVGKGTTFRVYLPLEAQDAEAAGAES